MKKRSECNCPCHQNSSIMHIAPCCEPDPMKEKTKMSEKEFIEQKYGDNDWKHYPPSKNLVACWLKEYASLKQSDTMEKLICPECENPYPHSHTDGSYSCEDCGHKWKATK